MSVEGRKSEWKLLLCVGLRKGINNGEYFGDFSVRRDPCHHCLPQTLNSKPQTRDTVVAPSQTP